jgi:hypothetical protein
MIPKLSIFVLLSVSFSLLSCNKGAQNQSLLSMDSNTTVIDEKVVFANDTINVASKQAN